MIRDICKDEAFLARMAENAGPEDLQTAATCWKHWPTIRTAAWAWRPI